MFLAEFAQGVREGLKETLGTMNRSRMIMLAIIVAIALFVTVYLPYSLRDDSDNVTATCTVTKAYTKDRGGSDVSGMPTNPRIVTSQKKINAAMGLFCLLFSVGLPSLMR